MVKSLLSELGFSSKEADVYLEIVKSKDATTTDISKKTNLPRPTVYDILAKLLEKGIITQVVKSKKKTFLPTDFNKLISKVKEQELFAQLAVKELNKMSIKDQPEYSVEVFEGKEGLKSYFDYIESLLKSKKLKDYLVLGSNLESIRKIKFFLLSRLKSAFLLSKNVDYRVVWNHKSKNDLFRKSLELAGKHKFFPKECIAESTTIVFNNYVAIMFNSEKPVIVRIRSDKVSNTYRNQFNLFWKLIN